MIATVSTLLVSEATSWRRLFAVVVVVFGVALMHADSAAAQATAPDQPMVMAGQDLGLSRVAVLATTDPGQSPRLLAGPPFTSSPRGPPDLSALCVLRI